MTVKTMDNGKKIISWEPGDEPDWTTPDSEWHGHEFCGNCGLDVPGCGCPRDCKKCQEMGGYCGHLDGSGDADADDWEPCSHIHDEGCEDYQGFSACTHQHCMNCGGCGCPGYCDDHQTYNLRPAETGGAPDA